ncbi:hypothetical protein QMK50_04645 [Pseudomonas sp. P5_152]|uniref:hypothetical protein n=1 Tax=Pseudomonas sp. P5_152 TaxID=3043442 RepID=UPI002A35D60F|nr:hypothetical protein [Pseudomonas sp. P5_152]MDX9664255.1 hypothetical protein [Pseudomonas sp. P5_152]
MEEDTTLRDGKDMLLGKSCKKKDNVKTSNTIKLGTLFEYRESENQAISDKKEGSLDFNFFFDGEVTVSQRVFNTFAGGLMQIGPTGGYRFPGRGNAHFESFNIVEHGFDTITLQDSKGVINREALNSFIFCMSHVRETTECHGMFEGYDDYWYTHDGNIDHVGKILEKLLLKQIQENQKNGSHVIPKEIDASEIEITTLGGKVIYMDRDLHFTNETIHDLSEVIGRLHNMSFIKPSVPFQKEKEYRFQFIITHNGYMIEPLKKCIILHNCEELLPFVI